MTRDGAIGIAALLFAFAACKRTPPRDPRPAVSAAASTASVDGSAEGGTSPGSIASPCTVAPVITVAPAVREETPIALVTVQGDGRASVAVGYATPEGPRVTVLQPSGDGVVAKPAVLADAAFQASEADHDQRFFHVTPLGTTKGKMRVGLDAIDKTAFSDGQVSLHCGTGEDVLVSTSQPRKDRMGPSACLTFEHGSGLFVLVDMLRAESFGGGFHDPIATPIWNLSWVLARKDLAYEQDDVLDAESARWGDFRAGRDADFSDTATVEPFGSPQIAETSSGPILVATMVDHLVLARRDPSLKVPDGGKAASTIPLRRGALLRPALAARGDRALLLVAAGWRDVRGAAFATADALPTKVEPVAALYQEGLVLLVTASFTPTGDVMVALAEGDDPGHVHVRLLGPDLAPRFPAIDVTEGTVTDLRIVTTDDGSAVVAYVDHAALKATVVRCQAGGH